MAKWLGRIGGIYRTDPGLEVDAEGFDTYTEDVYVMAANEMIAKSIANADIGARGARGTTILVNARVRRDRARSWIVTKTYKGIIDAKPWRRHIRSFPDKARGTVTSFNNLGVPVAREVEVNDAMIGVSFSYIARGTPNTSLVSSRATPPRSVPVPAPKFRTISNPLEPLPYGWVLEGLDIDELPGTTICFVRADYVYYHRFKVGSNTFA